MKSLLPIRFDRRGIPKAGSHHTGRDGFTLLECVVVMAMIVVILAIAIPPASRWMEARSTGNAVDELRFQLQRAKMMAIKDHADTYLIAYHDINTYCIDNTGTNLSEPGPDAQCFQLKTYSDDVAFDSNSTDVVRFTPTGVARRNGSFTVTNDARGLAYRVTVTGAGGISRRRVP